MRDVDPRTLVIVTQLTGSGPTGVETHFRGVEQMALARGANVVRVDPHQARSAWIIVCKVVYRLLKIARFHGQVTYMARRINAAGLRKSLNKVIKTLPIGAVTFYAQDPMSTAVASEFAPRCKGRLVAVFHFNGSEWEEVVAKGIARPNSAVSRLLQYSEKYAINVADAIIFVSDYMRAIVLSRHYDAGKKGTIVRNFTEHEIVTQDVIPDRDLISIGTLEPRKNQLAMLQILAACARLGHIYTLTVVGDGPDMASLRAIAYSLGIEGQVDFLGWVSQAHQLLPRHRALIHTAALENMPLTLIEAMGHGRPILAAPVGGIPEIFGDGIEGLYLDITDIRTSAEQVIRLLETPGLALTLGCAARVRYLKHFSSEALGTLLFAVLFPMKD